MQNEEGQMMDLYIPRKWYTLIGRIPFCSATNRIITAKDHASVQINIGHSDESGVYTDQFTTYALCGFIRSQAEAWVNNMIASTTVEPSELEFEGRSPRLGLGAKVAPNARSVASTDPAERKLLVKLNASKRKFSKTREETNAAEDGDPGEEDDNDEEPEIEQSKSFCEEESDASDHIFTKAYQKE